MAPVEREINTNEKFLAHIAHDLKTPIKAQARAIELLFSGALGNLNENVQNMLINMNASNKYMQCLIDNILTDYRLNNFNFVLNKTDNDIRKTIEESVKNVEILFVSKKQRIVLNYFANSFIKNYDDIQIQRVIVNLLSNVYEYSKENSTVILNVKEEGVYLTVEIVSKISYLPKETASLNLVGAGDKIGFVNCSKIISMHNGIINGSTNSNGEYKVEVKLP